MAGTGKKKPMKRAYSYIRFSRAHQIEGDSLRRQTSTTAEYCKRHNLTLDDSLNLKDLGVSAFKGRNVEKGALGRFIAACQGGLVPRGSALILESLDRLSRQSPRKTINLLTQLLDLGIEIHLTQAGKIFKPEDECGVELIIAIAMAMRAYEESETKSKRLKEAFAQKRKLAAEGKAHVSKSLPWWLTWNDEGTAIICPDDRREILERIFREVLGGKSPLEVARTLNAEGKPTWRPKTKSWLDNRVRDTINSDAAIGTIGATPKTKVQGRKWEIARYYPAVIDPDTAAKARAILKGNRKTKSGPKADESSIPNLLKGILRYQTLWCRFSVHRTRIGTWNGYYEAVDDNRRMPWTIAANQLEPILLISIADLTPDHVKPPTAGNAETAILRAQTKDLESTLANITMAVEAGSTTMITRLVEIEKELAAARELLAAADAADNVAVDVTAMHQLAGYDPVDLKYPDRRVEIASSIRRLVSRVQVGSNLDDLATTPGQDILTLEDGDTILEDLREDPTGSRGKRPLAIHIKFHGGGEMAIQRGTEDAPDCIRITRIFRQGEPVIN